MSLSGPPQAVSYAIGNSTERFREDRSIGQKPEKDLHYRTTNISCGSLRKQLSQFLCRFVCPSDKIGGGQIKSKVEAH